MDPVLMVTLAPMALRLTEGPVSIVSIEAIFGGVVLGSLRFQGGTS